MQHFKIRHLVFWSMVPTIVLTIALVLLHSYSGPNGWGPIGLNLAWEAFAVLYLVWTAKRTGFSFLRAYSPQASREQLELVGWAVLTYLALIVGGEEMLTRLWNRVVESVGFTPPTLPDLDVSGAADVPLFIVSALVFAPFLEEFLFRGMILHVLRRWWGLLPAIVGSSILFGFAHGQGMLWKVILGCFLCILTLNTGSFFLNWLTHCAINAIASLSVVLALAHPEWNDRAPSDPGWFEGLVFLLGLWGCFVFFQKTRYLWRPRRVPSAVKRLLWRRMRRGSTLSREVTLRPPRHFLR